MNQITVNGYTATEYLPGSWKIQGASGNNWYWQGTTSDITQKLMGQPVIMPPTANGPLLPSPNVTNAPDGSTQVEVLQQAQADRSARRAAFEPDFIEPDEAAAYGNGNPGAASQLIQLQASINNWNCQLNDLRQCQGLAPLPTAAFDGSPPSNCPTSSDLPSWLPWVAALGVAWALFHKDKKHEKS